MTGNTAVANNIILFPPGHITHPKNTRTQSDVPLQTIEAIADNVAKEKAIRVNEMMEVISKGISDVFTKYQVNPMTTIEDLRYCVFMFESIKAMLNHNVGLGHPFHKIADKYVDTEKLSLFRKEEANDNDQEEH